MCKILKISAFSFVLLCFQIACYLTLFNLCHALVTNKKQLGKIMLTFLLD